MSATVESRCPGCLEARVSEVPVRRSVRADDGESVEFIDHLSRCAACGEQFYTREQAIVSSRARAGVLRHHSGLLSPHDIMAIRSKYGLTQAELERVLGTGPKTVVRWESGSVCQSRAADNLLRLVDQDEANLRRLADRSGLRLPMREFSGGDWRNEESLRSLFVYLSSVPRIQRGSLNEEPNLLSPREMGSLRKKFGAVSGKASGRSAHAGLPAFIEVLERGGVQ